MTLVQLTQGYMRRQAWLAGLMWGDTGQKQGSPNLKPGVKEIPAASMFNLLMRR